MSYTEEWAAAEARVESREKGVEPPPVAEETSVEEQGEPAEQKEEPPPAAAEAEAEEEEAEPEGKPKPSDWVAFRKHKKRLAAREAELEKKAAAKEAELAGKVDALAKQAAERLAPLDEARKAIESGDFDALAAALGKASGQEISTWNDLNKLVVQRFASPEYDQVLKLKREQENLRRELQEKQRREQMTATQAQQEQARANYMRELTEELGASEDDAVKAFAADQSFVRAVFSEQSAAYNQQAGTTITVDEAAKRAIAKARASYDELHKIFGDQAPNPEAPAATRRKPRTVPNRRAVEASPTKQFATEAELRKHFIQRLEAGT